MEVRLRDQRVHAIRLNHNVDTSPAQSYSYQCEIFSESELRLTMREVMRHIRMGGYGNKTEKQLLVSGFFTKVMNCCNF